MIHLYASFTRAVSQTHDLPHLHDSKTISATARAGREAPHGCRGPASFGVVGFVEILHCGEHEADFAFSFFFFFFFFFVVVVIVVVAGFWCWGWGGMVSVYGVSGAGGACACALGFAWAWA